MEYPKSFLEKYGALLSSCPFPCGRAQASFNGGVYDGIDDVLYRFTQRTDFPEFVKKATRLFQEHTKLVNYDRLKSEGDITIEKYCDLFLRHIYDLTKEKGADSLLNSRELKEFFSIKSHRECTNIFDILFEMDYLEYETESEDGTYFFYLNGKGTHFIESGGKTGIIKSFLTNSTVYNDHSVNVGSNYGQAFTGSKNVTQYLTIENPADILDKLDNMKRILQESLIETDEKEDALATIATVENEVKKKKPISSIIFSSLEALSNVASISSAAYGLAKILGAPLP